MKPINSNVLIKRSSPKADRIQSSLIVIPDSTSREYSWIAEVLEVGPGEWITDYDGNMYREEMYIKPGDKVLCWPGYISAEGLDKDTYIVDISMIDGVLEE
jgi:co-chaperonin GroES (HSP10)